MTAAAAASGQGWTGPQTASPSVMSLGPNGRMNGFLPFCPAPTHCSVIYKDISAEPLDTVNNSLFHTYNGGSYDTSQLVPNFETPNATMPWHTVDSSASTPLRFLPAHSTDIPTQSDDTVLPLECGAMIQEGGGNPCLPWTGDGRDRHLGIIDRNHAKGTVIDYETYQLETRDGVLREYSNTIWNLLLPIEEQNTGGYTSADAAGMPQLAMGVTYEDLSAGDIKHALRMTVPASSVGFYAHGDAYGLYASPASHAAPKGGGRRVAYMGEWLRLKASTPLPRSCGPHGTVIFRAMKKHGLIVADNGRFGLFQGTYDPRINYSDVRCLEAVTGADLEVVQVQHAKVVAGELNPETQSMGKTVAYDQTGFTSSSSGVQGTLISSTPAAPTATCTASATTIKLGSSVTFHVAATNAVKSWIDHAYGVITGADGGSLAYTPSQTATYTAKVRGLNGYATADCGTVTLVGRTVATPTLSPAPGPYSSPQSISLAEATPATTIYYTTDGSTPTASSPIYRGPLTVSSPVTIKAMAATPGQLNSPIASGTYLVSIPGATPSVIGAAISGGLKDTPSLSIPYSFKGGTAAVISMDYTNSAALPLSVVCGKATATLIASQAMANYQPNYTVAAYFIPSVPPGSQTCSIKWPVSVYAAAAVTEVAGTTGLDGMAATGTRNRYPQMECGTVTITGSNRLLMVAGEMIYSSVAASKGYRQVFGGGAFAQAMIAVPRPAVVAATLHSNNDSPGSCLSFALKP